MIQIWFIIKEYHYIGVLFFYQRKCRVEDIPDEPIPTPETYEDYIKLSDACLQKDDVIQALAVLDEGEILSGRVLECDENGNEIKDLYYDRGGEINRSEEYQYDAGGNQIKHTKYDENDEITGWTETVYDGRIGVCCNFGGHVGANEEFYYFFDGKGKKEITLGDYQRFLEDGTESRGYCISDNDSFESRDISTGEDYDIADKIVSANTIDWQMLEEPDK